MQTQLFLHIRRSSFALIAILFCQAYPSAGAFARPPAPSLPNAATFIFTANLRWTQLLRSHSVIFTEPAVGVPGFVPLTVLIRGQSQISVENIDAKLLEKLTLQDLNWTQGHWGLGQDQGRSIVPTADPISVIKGPQGYVVTDGHHDLYLSLFVGASTIAIRVEEDLSHLSPIEFWKNLKRRHLVLLPETAAELAKRPPDMAVIKNNPNRYLAALLALKVQADLSRGMLVIQKVKGSPDAVWVKLNSSIPFIEFYLADLISSLGIEYDSRWGTQVPGEIISKVRTALQNPHSSPRAEKINELFIISEAHTKMGIAQNYSLLTQELLKHQKPKFGPQCGAAFQF